MLVDSDIKIQILKVNTCKFTCRPGTSFLSFTRVPSEKFREFPSQHPPGRRVFIVRPVTRFLVSTGCLQVRCFERNVTRGQKAVHGQRHSTLNGKGGGGWHETFTELQRPWNVGGFRDPRNPTTYIRGMRSSWSPAS